MPYRGKRMNNTNQQTHVHELLGSVQIGELQDPHSHRFATMTGEVIPYNGTDHYHEVSFRTDFFNEHYHDFHGYTSTAIPTGKTHVHYLEAATTFNDGHDHGFKVVTLIDDPTKP